MSRFEGHTPGPWGFHGTRIGGDASVTAADRIIASVHPRRLRAPFQEDNAERDANACLIAAAPTMAADIDEFMRRLGPRWFLEQGWFPASLSDGPQTTPTSATMMPGDVK